MILNILMYVLLAYMVINMIRNSRQRTQNQSLVSVINAIQDPDEFFRKADEMIETSETELYINKGRVLKLWGSAYHERYDMFQEVLNTIDTNALISRKNGTVSILSSEDSFFYLYLAIPNILEGNKQRAYREMLAEKLAPVSEELKNQMVVQLSGYCDQYYREEGDKGLSSFEKILEGDYEGVDYSKNLIGLYKMVCSAMCAKIYEVENNTEKYEEVLPMTQSFAKTGVGRRWLKSIDLQIEEQTEDLSGDETAEDHEDSE